MGRRKKRAPERIRAARKGLQVGRFIRSIRLTHPGPLRVDRALADAPTAPVRLLGKSKKAGALSATTKSG